MRLKDINGKYTEDSDIVLECNNEALQINVEDENKIVFTLDPLVSNADTDGRYQAADPRLITHLTDRDNPHQTISYFVEQYVNEPASGDIIYEMVAPISTAVTIDIATIELYVYATNFDNVNNNINIEIEVNGTSIFANNRKVDTLYGWQNEYYFICAPGTIADTGWTGGSTYTLSPGDYVKVYVYSKTGNVGRMSFRMICW